MELRDHLRRTGARSEGKQQSEKEMFTTVIGRDTECIVISNSQGKWIDRERIFGRRKTIKIKCSKAEDLLSFSKDMLNGQSKNQVMTILINNLINNLRNVDNVSRIAELQRKSMNALQEACPRAQIIYSLPLKCSRRYDMNPLAQEMGEFCDAKGLDFMTHSLHPRLFSDEFHLSEEGTKAFVARIHRHTYGPKWDTGERRVG